MQEHQRLAGAGFDIVDAAVFGRLNKAFFHFESPD
jgi:hypothetical protein